MRASVILAIFFCCARAIIVDKAVEDALRANGRARVILQFKGPRPSDIFNMYQAFHRPQIRTVAANVFPDMLNSIANRQQARTLRLLQGRISSNGPEYQFLQLWAYNMLAIRNLDSALLAELNRTCEIERIVPDFQFIGITPIAPSVNDPPPPDVSADGNQWGVEDIQAPAAWARGFRGQGVVVGTIDTGIRATHDILRSNFRSSFGWFDAVNGRTTPYDDNGHGSHVAGTIAGINGFGVAPNATLIACKAFDSRGSGSSSATMACGQFMLCPTDPSGNNRDCSQAPKIISNSWSYPGLNTFYDNTVQAWINNNQIAIFANGNSGPGCTSTGSPAGYVNSIGVGATDVNNQLASFSSRGPAGSNVKPNIAAPGVSIVSAGIGSDSATATLSGTSMATPHVAGAAAILCSQNPGLNQGDVSRRLTTGTVGVDGVAQNAVCGNTGPGARPNNFFGFGKIQILAGLDA